MTDTDSIFLTVGRDYRVHGKYEFVLYRGEEIIAREGFFKTSAKARREGMKAAQNIEAAS